MKTLATCLLMLLMAGLQAQHLDTQAFTSGGNSLSFSGGVLEVSVGEMGIQSLSSGNLLLTQGVLQPHITSSVGIENHYLTEHVMRVYPNPTADAIRIELDSDQAYQGQILDAGGRLAVSFSVQNSADFDVSYLSAGTYLLVLTDEDRDSRFTVRFVKQ